jgi:hypothetical protein
LITEIGGRRIASPPAPLGRLVVAAAGLRRAVEIRVERHAHRHRRLDEQIAKRVAMGVRLHAQRSVSAVIGVVELRVGFGLAKIGQNIRVGPAGIAALRPAVVVAGVAAHVDHVVQDAGAADDPAARIGDPTIEQLFLRRSGEGPIGAGLLHVRGGARNRRQAWVRVASRLKQDDRAVRVFAEARGEDATRRSGADDDVVKTVNHRRSLG